MNLVQQNRSYQEDDYPLSEVLKKYHLHILRATAKVQIYVAVCNANASTIKMNVMESIIFRIAHAIRSLQDLILYY